MSKKKLSLTDQITLAENNAVDFTHACITIALHDCFALGRERLDRVNRRREEINEQMLEIMAQPQQSGREQAEAGQAWLLGLLPEGTEPELRVPLAKGAARKRRELQVRMAVDRAATLEWRVYAAACAEVLGFGAKRLNCLWAAVLGRETWKGWYGFCAGAAVLLFVTGFPVPSLQPLLQFVMTYLLLLAAFDLWERVWKKYPALNVWGWLLFGGLGFRAFYVLSRVMGQY